MNMMNMDFKRKLPIPMETKEMYPLSDELSGVIEETRIDSAALIEGLGYASSDIVRIVLLLLLMAACCTAAVWVCTKKFNARNLLND